jgi:hypothetical protein
MNDMSREPGSADGRIVWGPFFRRIGPSPTSDAKQAVTVVPAVLPFLRWCEVSKDASPSVWHSIGLPRSPLL